jgi:hypothetical protein
MGTPGRAWAAAGCAIGCLPAVDSLVTGIIRGCARHIHPSSIARTSPLRISALSRRQGLIARPLTTMR